MLQAYAIFTIILVFKSVDLAQPTNVKGSHDFDLLIYTQHWPPTVCREWKQHNSSHVCAYPSNKDFWTIHGIWPTRKGSIGPQFCNRTWHFDPKQITPIEKTLLQSWINIEADTPTYGLWTHEWSKHGTCAAALPPLNSEFKYFSKGLEWLQSFQMASILDEVNIVPSNDNTYSLVHIYSAIKNKLGVNPIIECRREDGKNWLFELRICFDKNLELADCDGAVGAEKTVYLVEDNLYMITNCDSNDIIYPSYSSLSEEPPKLLYVQLYKLISWIQWLTL